MESREVLDSPNEKLRSEIAELRGQLNYSDEAIDSLCKELQQLTKRSKKPKRVSSNYLKYKKGRSDS